MKRTAPRPPAPAPSAHAEPASPPPPPPPPAESVVVSLADTPFAFRDYVRARDLLLAHVRRGPCYAVVTGPSGVGKSTLRRDLEALLDRHRYQLVYLSSSSVSVVGFARFLSLAVRLTPRRSHMETVAELARTLKAQPAHVVLWLDEADQVAVETLTELRILAECDQDAPQIFSLVLSGLPDLRGALDARELAPLRRRIGLRCALTGLGRDELTSFLVHRLGELEARCLPATLHDELFERTQGVPALIHKVAQAALELAGERRVVSEEVLRAACDASTL